MDVVFDALDCEVPMNDVVNSQSEASSFLTGEMFPLQLSSLLGVVLGWKKVLQILDPTSNEELGSLSLFPLSLS